MAKADQKHIFLVRVFSILATVGATLFVFALEDMHI